MEKTNPFLRIYRFVFVIICMFGVFIPHHVFSETETVKLSQAIENYIVDHEETTAGLAAITIKNGEITPHIHGHTSIEQNFQVDDETVFEWGSTSKLVVWLSVMQLMEDGRLDLQADIRNYVPEDFTYPNAHKEPITMLHLMNHTAGFDESFTDLMLLDPIEMPTLKEALERADVRQVFAPGEIVAYSNYGTALAAYIVEEVSGMDYREYVKKHIFIPLEMDETAIDTEQDDNKWVKEQRKKIQGYTTDLEVIFPSDYSIPLYPAGSIVGTATDFAKLVNFFLSEDGDPLFKNTKTIDKLFETTAYYPETDLPRIAHGFFALHGETDVYGHGGNTMAFSSSIYVDRKNKIGLVIMTNQANEEIFNLGLPELIFGRAQINEATHLEDASVWKGTYQPARSPFHGFSKIYGLLNRSTVKVENTYDLKTNNLHYKQKQPGVYVTEDDFSLYSVDTYASHPTYKKVLSAAYGDLIPIPMYQHAFELTLFITGLIAVLFSVIYIVIQLIQALRIRLEKRKISQKHIVIQHVLNVSVVANMCWMIYSVLGMTTLDSLKISFIFNIVYVIVTVVLCVYHFISRKKVSHSKRKKVVEFVTIIAALIISMNVMYWEFYW